MLSESDFVQKQIIVVSPKNGDKISFRNDNIVIENSDGDIKHQSSCYRLFAVFIIGGVNVTSGIIAKSKKFGFSIVLFTMGFKVYSTINFSLEGNTLLRKRQYNTEKSSEIAQHIIINKIQNQRNTLIKIRNENINDGIDLLDKFINMLRGKAYSISEIMGIEGTASKVYFNRLFKEFGWNGRQPRLKLDKINLLMDIGYTVLFNYLEAVLNIYGFDIYKGNLHQEFYKRKSLVCDIIEPFRPIVDYKIRKMFNLGQFNQFEFNITNNQYQLKFEDSNKFVSLILSEIMEYKVVVFQYVQQFYRWLMKGKDILYFPKVFLKNDSC